MNIDNVLTAAVRDYAASKQPSIAARARSEIAAEVRLRESAERDREQAIKDRDVALAERDKAIAELTNMKSLHDTMMQAHKKEIDAMRMEAAAAGKEREAWEMRCLQAEGNMEAECRRAADADKRTSEMQSRVTDLAARMAQYKPQAQVVQMPAPASVPVAYTIKVTGRSELGEIKELKMTPNKNVGKP